MNKIRPESFDLRFVGAILVIFCQTVVHIFAMSVGGFLLPGMYLGLSASWHVSGARVLE